MVLMVWEGEGWWKQNFFCFSVYESPKKWEEEEALVADGPSCSSWQLWTVPALSGRVHRCEKGDDCGNYVALGSFGTSDSQNGLLS